MKRILILFTVLASLASTLATAQVASGTQYGVFKYDPAYFQTTDGIFQPKPGAGGSGSFPAELGVPVTTKTSDAIQAAINAATGKTTIVLSGTYVQTGGISLINKSDIMLVSYDKAVIDAGTSVGTQLFMHDITNISIRGITFNTQKSGFDYGQIFVNEQGPLTNLEVAYCTFTAPNAGYNGISITAAPDGSSSTTIHRGIRLHNNRFVNCGRMGIEITQHRWNGTPQIFDIYVTDNWFENLGLNDINGMAVSISGEIQNVTVSNNTAINHKNVGIEFIGTRSFVATGNRLITTATFNGNLSAGISFTDGGNTGHGARNGTVSANNIKVNGNPYTFNGAQDIKIGIGFISGQQINAQHANRVTFSGIKMVAAGQHNITLDGSSNCLITGCNLIMANPTGGKYENIVFINSSLNNIITGGRLEGTNDNGSNINILADGRSTGNRWNGIFNVATNTFLNNLNK